MYWRVSVPSAQRGLVPTRTEVTPAWASLVPSLSRNSSSTLGHTCRLSHLAHHPASPISQTPQLFAMSSKNYNGAPPKYLNDFSKALAGEVRILLAEVGKLRDERRQLQYEIAELMSVKSKHGAGGEYSPEWKPKELQPEDAPPPPAPEEEGAVVAPARPGWRIVHKRAERKERALAKIAPSPAPPPPPPESPRPNMPAWAQWRPNPLLSPMPVPAAAAAPPPSMPPPRSGLFGPPTPPPPSK